MKNINLTIFCFLVLFCCFLTTVQAQKYPKTKNIKTEKVSKENDYYAPYDDENEYMRDISWKQKGFEFYIGGGIYLAGKKTANYYNGAPKNNINLNLLFNNKYYRENLILPLLKEAYPYIDTMLFREKYDTISKYSIAMDVSLGARYRFHKNWYLELSYSFRRISCENPFVFDFPGVVPGNKENPPYSNREYLIAKEDRHYIDFSAGYIFQNNPAVKPFFSLGVQFNYINIKSFLAVIEEKPFDLMHLAKYPDETPDVQPMPDYRVWAGPGYGFSLTAGLKIAVNPSISLDPIFQLSVGSFGNSENLPNFNTDFCFNYMVGVHIVMSDAFFYKK